MKRNGTPVAVLLAAALGLAACGTSSDPLASASSSAGGASTSAAAGPVVVGGADFSESTLLAEIYAGALRAKGVDASTRTNIGSREVYLKALGDDSIQVFPEYTGALAIYFDKTFAKTDPGEVYDGLKALLPKDLVLLDKSAAEDNDSIVVTKETAAAKNLRTIDDLKAVAGSLVLSAPPEFKARPQGIPGLEKSYGVVFKSFVPLKGQAIVQALKNGQADAANIFSTDPAIAANGFVALEDTKKLFGSQNIVPLVRADTADQVSAVLNAVSAKLTTAAVADMLKKTDIDKADPKAVAEEFLKANGLA